VLTYFLLGALAGAITGVPIGPVNVAIIDAAYRHHVKRAVAVGMGGALGDFFYASLGIVGVGRFLSAHAVIPPILYGVSGVALIAYGLITVRSQPPDPTGAPTSDGAPQRYFWSGFGLGAALILLNPAALITWVFLGSQVASDSVAEGWAAAVGVGVGSCAWFVFVAYAADHGKRVLGDKARWITRVVGVVLLGVGVFSLGRAAWFVYRIYEPLPLLFPASGFPLF
jgi:threonine/homoserine/homoserine lactone efflux protein